MSGSSFHAYRSVPFGIGPNGGPVHELVNFERIVARRHYRDLRRSGVDRFIARQYVADYWRRIARARS